MRWVASDARWIEAPLPPDEWPPFDGALLRGIPGHIPSGVLETQKLTADLAALQAAHDRMLAERDDLGIRQDVLAVRYAELEALALERMEAVDAAERKLAEARREIADQRATIAKLRTDLDQSVPRAQLDALRAALDRREVAYRQLLAGAGLTSTRSFYRSGVITFDGLFQIAASDERPDERDEAAAVVLEHLSGRLSSFFDRPSADDRPR